MPTLAAGTRLTCYEILAPLGAGAMGQVWRARDTRLGREVAIKVLPEQFASDAERLKRFEREAQTLASLNHPNVAQIFGVDQVGDVCFLVLELVEGESLEERLKRGALPLDEVLDTCRQIADGLEAAHDAGVIHRDLKPANVLVTPDGRVKLLDFGLAKPSRERDPVSSTDSVLSTEAGRLLGTPTYMAPEQVRGRPIDRRVDIWAFGCVLYECLCARRAFAGDTLSDVLAAVIERDADLSRLPEATPPRVRELLRACLEKDPRQRLRDIGDARLALEHARGGTPEAAPAPRRRNLVAPAAVLGGLLLAAAAYLVSRQQEPAAARVMRSSLVIPADVRLLDGDGALALSPDGGTLVFVGVRSHEDAFLWSRPLDSAVPQSLAGTENPSYPFWSPDGRSIGFFADGKLKRIPARGGPVTTICDAVDGRGATWSTDDTIILAPEPFGPLLQVSASGGTPAVLTEVAATGSHRLPHVLPDGRHVVYTEAMGDTLGVHLLDLATRTSRKLLDDLSEGLVSPPGWLVFVRSNELVVQAFDWQAGRLTGDVRRLTEQVNFVPPRCTGAFTISAEGTLVYKSAVARQRVEEFDFAGQAGRQLGEPAAIVSVFVSPDATRLAQTRPRDDGKLDLWVVDTQRGLGSTLAEDLASPIVVWSPDGGSLAYATRIAGQIRPSVRALDGSPPRVLAGTGGPMAWSPDGLSIVLSDQAPETQDDIVIVRADGSGERRPLVRTPASESALCYSPNGRWLLVTGTQSGMFVLYAMPADGAGPIQPLLSSSDGVFAAWWFDDGRIVYFAGASAQLQEITTHEQGAGLEVGAPREVSTGGAGSANWGTYTRDGKRVFVVTSAAEDSSQVLTVVRDWRAALGGE